MTARKKTASAEPWPAPLPPRRLYVAEPRSVWLQRAPVVSDCSVWGALLFAEPNGGEAAALLAQRALHAPTLLPYEIASVASKKLRMGATAGEIDAAIAAFDEQRIELHAVSPGGCQQLAARYTLSTYDAAYLWLAAELRAPLVTFDRKLGAVAQAHLGASGA